jgi:hypothetical protein
MKITRRANLVGTKNCGGEERSGKARAGKNSFLLTPFLFARPSVRFSFLPREARQSAPVRAQIVAQRRFALRSVIATNLNIANFAGSWFARSPRLCGAERAINRFQIFRKF